MRFFIAFLLLACLYFPSASASEDLTIAVPQKSIKKSSPIFDKVTTLATKSSNSLSKEPFSDHLDRIYQTVNNHSMANVVGLMQRMVNYLFAPILIVYFFNNTNNYSYQFIFNCLFPKHTFW
ncbi:hypothetical protein [Pedobacter sp. Hv1]|uniref:hypothetical protein n=1 Tax=Pedobacter sp. Hv1 TaxID=1740090 RepID=UPI0006D8BF0C|nr:hypothetical protein [Pedobacter sp. Hv1]KQC02772.1 hypothetical protein AQF98_04140 [Pedobacter sp. Hv1]